MLRVKALIYIDAKPCGIRCNPLYLGSIPPASTRLTIQGLSAMLIALVLSRFQAISPQNITPPTT